jgi:hypothetical protein
MRMLILQIDLELTFSFSLSNPLFLTLSFPPAISQSAVSADIFQAYAKPLLVKPGGTVTVTTNFVVDKLPTGAITTGVR